jgi:hypothetical protein
MEIIGDGGEFVERITIQELPTTGIHGKNHSGQEPVLGVIFES